MERAAVGQHHFVQSALPAVIGALLSVALLLVGVGVVWDQRLERCARAMAMRVAPGQRATQELDLAVGGLSRAALITRDTGNRAAIDEARGRLDSAAASYDSWAAAAHIAERQPAAAAAWSFISAVEVALRTRDLTRQERELRAAVDAISSVLRANSNVAASEAMRELERFAQFQHWRRFMEMALLALLVGGCAIGLFVVREREARACHIEAESFRQLERANADLDAFAGRVAHDLRNPLVPILSGSQIIERSDIDERARRAAERIERAARRLSRMIDLLLDFSRQTARPVAPAQCDVRAVLSEIVDALGDRIRDDQVRLDVEVEQLRCACESIVLASPVQNLIENALKYGRRPGVPPLIRLRAFQRGGAVIVEVEDNGPGITPCAAEQLFCAFQRGVEGGEGIGLGLATARRLVESRGGTLSLRAGRLGGALFQIRLPAAAQRLSEEREQRRMPSA